MPQVSKEKESVRQMFDDISGKYDFLNHFLSLGTDFRWRKKMVATLQKKKVAAVLDVATGTGDLAIEMSRIGGVKITGIDISGKMLEIAGKKITEKGLADRIRFRQSDAEAIPFSDRSFDAVTVAFGVRNFENLKKGLTEMKRVLRPGGCMLILEFSHPSTFPMKQLYRFYSRFIIPFFGKMISRNAGAYRYLPESVAAFPSGNDFLRILSEIGMINGNRIVLSYGIATIYYCETAK